MRRRIDSRKATRLHAIDKHFPRINCNALDNTKQINVFVSDTKIKAREPIKQDFSFDGKRFFESRNLRVIPINKTHDRFETELSGRITRISKFYSSVQSPRNLSVPMNL